MHQQPTSVAEYTAAYHDNTRITGTGLDTTTHFPCPFCAAPDFMSAKILDTQSAMEQDSTCTVCGRSGKSIFTNSPGQTSFEFVQTGGDDLPDWFIPKMRRV